MEQNRQKKGGASNTPPLTNNIRTGESSTSQRYR